MPLSAFGMMPDEEQETDVRPRCSECRLGIMIPRARNGRSLMMDCFIELSVPTCDVCGATALPLTHARTVHLQWK